MDWALLIAITLTDEGLLNDMISQLTKCSRCNKATTNQLLLVFVIKIFIAIKSIIIIITIRSTLKQFDHSSELCLYHCL